MKHSKDAFGATLSHLGLAEHPRMSGSRITVAIVAADPGRRADLAARLESGRHLWLEVIQFARLETALHVNREPGLKAFILNEDVSAASGLERVGAAVEQAGAVPIIVVSDVPEPDVAADVLALGAQEYLCAADLDQEDLGRCVVYAIERRGLHMQLSHHLCELEHTKMRFRSLIIDNADALMIVAANGLIRFANPAAERLLQQDSHDLVDSELGVAIESREEPEVEFVLKDGRNVTVAMRFMQTLWDGERAYIVTLRDITERKTAEQALKQAMQHAEEASQMKSQFLANMSHELRTPLNSILGFSEMMSRETFGKLGNARYYGYAENINAAGAHLLGLINDLLDLSKVEAGKLELEEAEFEPAEAIDSVCQSLSPRADQAGLSLEWGGVSEDLRLLGDARRIKQVLFNLISNAIKFTPHGGRVAVMQAVTADGSFVMSVTDTGIGIPADQLPKALEAFGQVKNPYKAGPQEGTGLGLAVTKELVELHGGSLELESRVGEGTKVTVLLPSARIVLPRLLSSAG